MQPTCKKCGFIAGYRYLPKFFRNPQKVKISDPEWLFHVKRFCPDCGIFIAEGGAFVKQTNEVIDTMQQQLDTGVIGRS